MVVNSFIALIWTRKGRWGKFYFINIQCIPKQMHRDDPQQLSSKISIALVAFKNQFQGTKLDAQYL